MTDISSGVGGCVAIKDVKVPAKSPPLARGRFRGFFRDVPSVTGKISPGPSFPKRGNTDPFAGEDQDEPLLSRLRRSCR